MRLRRRANVVLLGIVSERAGGLIMTADEPDKIEKQTAVATFAGGCFWCMEPPFDAESGVLETIVGYTGGTVENPTYEQVSAGSTGHTEAIQIVYDPVIVSYERLLEIFWQNIDPLDPHGQASFDAAGPMRPRFPGALAHR